MLMSYLLWVLVAIEFVLCGRAWWRYVSVVNRKGAGWRQARRAKLYGTAAPDIAEVEAADKALGPSIVWTFAHTCIFWVLFVAAVAVSLPPS